MSGHPFDCLLVSSRDQELDQLFTRMLQEGGFPVEHVPVRVVLETLQARTRPAIVIKNLDSATGQWWRTVQGLAAHPEVTQRFGYVLLTVYREWIPQLAEHLPPDHTVTVLPLPANMAHFLHTVEQVGALVVSRWERAS